MSLDNHPFCNAYLFVLFKIKTCFQCIIKSACEACKGVSNLWGTGRGPGARRLPDYAQYVPIYYFKAFLHVLPLLWAPKEYWFRDPRTLPWDIIKPLFKEINNLRRALLTIVYLVLDETMSGFRPKTSPCGGYPNITYEPRKPCEISTMIRNAIECMTGMFSFQDPVKDLVSQRLKDFLQDDTDLHLPGGGNLPIHTAEVLRQVEGTGLIIGGWVCGDAWFGSSMSAVELRIRKGIYSSELRFVE